jgi:GNAT superfamily N-acetyltransferase
VPERDLLIRPARRGEELAVARVHVRAWQQAYRGILPDGYLESLSAPERAARYRFADPDPRQPATLVAVEGGVILGFATTAPARDADAGDCGELCGLYVDPDRWARGTGAALLAAAQAHLQGAGRRHAHRAGVERAGGRSPLPADSLEDFFV